MKSGREVEVFAQLGKCGSLASADIEALCRLSSIYLRAGGKLEDVARQLKGIGSHLQQGDTDVSASVPDSLGRALAEYLAAKKKHGLKTLVLGEDAPAEPEKPKGANA
jgi:ribonucleoside-diphosphate reductase alpha chain